MIEAQAACPTDHQRLAINRGIEAMGLNPQEVPVVFTGHFDATVRRTTGSTTYSSDRGTGTVAAKTLRSGTQSIIILNAVAVEPLKGLELERLAAHESGHVLLHRRNEYFGGPPYHANSEWHHALAAMGAFAFEEYRIEKSLAARGYPASTSCHPDHLATVLHWTNAELLQLVWDPASAEVRHLCGGVLGLADRLTKVLGYAAAFDLDGDYAVRLASEGVHAVEGWRDYVEPNWSHRRETYRQLPSADEALTASDWRQHVAVCAEVERSLVHSMGFEFRDGPDGDWLFNGRLGNQEWQARIERALAQEGLYHDT